MGHTNVYIYSLISLCFNIQVAPRHTHTREVTSSGVAEDTTMTYSPASPRKSAGKSYLAEIATPKPFA